MTSQSCPRLSSGLATCTECLKISLCEYYHITICPLDLLWEEMAQGDYVRIFWILRSKFFGMRPSKTKI